MKEKLTRSQNRILGGVCSGLAEYFDIDVVLIRIIFILTILVSGAGLIIYIILWVALPEENDFKSNNMEKIEDVKTGEPTEPHHNGRRGGRGKLIPGIILILLGGFFLLEKFIPDFDWKDYWPLFLIGVGIWFIIDALIKKN